MIGLKGAECVIDCFACAHPTLRPIGPSATRASNNGSGQVYLLRRCLRCDRRQTGTASETAGISAALALAAGASLRKGTYRYAIGSVADSLSTGTGITAIAAISQGRSCYIPTIRAEGVGVGGHRAGTGRSSTG